MSRQLILIRHGEVEKQFHNRYIGRTNIDLSQKGIKQAIYLQNELKNIGPFICLSSPLKRAYDTAQLATQELDINIELCNDLMEIDFGDWETMNFNEIEKQYPVQAKKWIADGSDFCFPKGESIKSFSNRIKAISKNLHERTDQNICLFSHGGVIRALICELCGFEPRNAFAFEINYGSRTYLKMNEGLSVITSLNNR